MKNQNYTTVITVNKGLKEAMIGVNNVSKWWTENFEGSAQNLGDVFTVRFGDTFVTAEIIEVVADHKIVWHIKDCNLLWLKDKKEWLDTKAVFEFSSENDATKITFTHIGLVPLIECYNDCTKGWDQYINGSLFKLITEGKGHPEKKKMGEPIV